MALTQVQSGMISGVSGSAISGSQSIPSSTLPAGSVLQAVFASYSSTFTTTSNTLSATGLQATITPKFATSKILVLCVNSVYVLESPGADVGCGVGIARNGTLVYNDGNGFNNFYYSLNSGSYNFRNRTPFNYLDSPASTSALTYAVYLSTWNGTAKLNSDGQASSITLLEIAA